MSSTVGLHLILAQRRAYLAPFALFSTAGRMPQIRWTVKQTALEFIDA